MSGSLPPAEIDAGSVHGEVVVQVDAMVHVPSPWPLTSLSHTSTASMYEASDKAPHGFHHFKPSGTLGCKAVACPLGSTISHNAVKNISSFLCPTRNVAFCGENSSHTNT